MLNRGADISKYNVAEQEILYKTNSSFVVNGIKKVDGITYMFLSEG